MSTTAGGTLLRIIVLDCFTRMGLAVVNALDRSYELVGGDAELPSGRRPRRDRFLRSPRLRDVFRYPPVGRRPEEFREAILDACRRYQADAVFPTSSATVLALSRLQSELRGEVPATFICESWEKVSRLADKWGLHGAALELGLPTPRTVLAEPDRLDEAHALGLPVVAKPRLAEAAQGIRFLASREEVERFVGSDRPASARSSTVPRSSSRSTSTARCTTSEAASRTARTSRCSRTSTSSSGSSTEARASCT